jgi:tRNA G18 (ribose-2'-O)-methylase SpoU
MITSAQNPIIQAIRAVLGHPRQRREAGVFVIEGVRLAEEAVNSGWPVQQAFPLVDRRLSRS